MNSMRLFNKEYLFQNIKKSLGALCVFVCLVPILNFILLLFIAISNKNGEVFSLETLSLFNYVGIFIIPLVLSICFFGFIFKKKQVDFINSMPLSRASIFTTNTVGGILIILAMMIINVILIELVSICFPNIIIPFGLILDYFIFWLVSYIFVFTVSNLASSLSGNAITSIVVTALILFLIPFCHQYISAKNIRNNNKNIYVECNGELCVPDKYNCTGVEYCNLKAKNKTYSFKNINTENYSNYTMPYFLISNIFTNSSHNLLSMSRLLKMLILSVIYILIGLFVFSKRKMENCETSFNDIKVHLLVKCLTLVPIMVFFYEVVSIDNDISSIIILILFIVLLLAYYFIYDLVTKHGIKNVKLSLLYFVGAVIILYLACALNEAISNIDRKDTIIKNTDITSVKITFDNSDLMDLKLTDREIIDSLIGYGLRVVDYESNKEYNQVKTSYFVNGKSYTKMVNILDEEFDSLLKLLDEKDLINKELKNLFKTNIIGYKIDNHVFKYDPALNKILTDISSSLNINDYYESVNSYSCRFTLYEYKNHDVVLHKIPCDLSLDLKNYVDDKRTEILKNVLESNHTVMNISMHGDIDEELYDKYYYVIDKVKEDLLDFISKNIKTPYDSSKDTIVLSIYVMGTSYEYYTNDIEAITTIIDKRIDEVKNTDDYKEYLNSLDLEKQEKYRDDYYE